MAKKKIVEGKIVSVDDVEEAVEKPAAAKKTKAVGAFDNSQTEETPVVDVVAWAHSPDAENVSDTPAEAANDDTESVPVETLRIETDPEASIVIKVPEDNIIIPTLTIREKVKEIRNNTKYSKSKAADDDPNSLQLTNYMRGAFKLRADKPIKN
jgi:hypothetical protein